MSNTEMQELKANLIHKPINRVFDYDIAKSEYIEGGLSFAKIRDKYDLNHGKYMYLCNKGIKNHWSKDRQRFNTKVEKKTVEIVAKGNAEVISKFKRILDGLQDDLLQPQSKQDWQNNGQKSSTMDMCVKNIQLLTGQATENINISDEAKTITRIFEKLH